MRGVRLLAGFILAAGFASGRATTPSAEPVNLTVCKQEVRTYVESGAYEQAVAHVAAQASAWVEHRVAESRRGTHRATDARLALVMDLDDTLFRNASEIMARDFGYDPAVWNAWVQAAKAPPLAPVCELYRTARRLGIAVILLTARPERDRAASERNLRAIDCGDYAALICRPDDSEEESGEFKRRERRRLAADGFVIIANVGDQWSDFLGGGAERDFKLPNPFYLTR